MNLLSLRCFGILSGAVLLLAGCTPPPGVGNQSKAEQYFNAGKNSLDREDVSSAKAAFSDALLADPQMARAHFELGGIYDREDELVKALYHYVRVIELDPEFHGADLISKRMNSLKMRINPSFPGQDSPIVRGEIEKVEIELGTWKTNYSQLRVAYEQVLQQLKALQGAGRNPPIPVPADQNGNSGGQPGQSGGTGTPQNPGNSGQQTYVVQQGDTYYSLGRRWGIDHKLIMEANPTVPAASLKVGMTIVIPNK